MANLITLIRLLLLFILIALLVNPGIINQSISLILIPFIYSLDAIDGYLARKYNTSSHFGSLFDVSVDRITEISLFFTLAYLHYLALWVPLLFITRGYLVDTLRFYESGHNEVVFDSNAPPLTKFLIISRFSRVFYMALKSFTIWWFVLFHFFKQITPQYWPQWSTLIIGFGNVLIYFCVLLCVLRAMPVFVDFFKTHKNIFNNKAGQFRN